MRPRIRFALTGCAAILVACGGGSTAPANNNNNGGNNNGGDNGGNGNGLTASVGVSDNAFSPDSVQVLVGGTVTWTWSAYDTHNVTFSTAGIENSTTQSTGTFDVMFAKAGVYSYHCTRHAQMLGKVVVQ